MQAAALKTCQPLMVALSTGGRILPRYSPARGRARIRLPVIIMNMIRALFLFRYFERGGFGHLCLNNQSPPRVHSCSWLIFDRISRERNEQHFEASGFQTPVHGLVLEI